VRRHTNKKENKITCHPPAAFQQKSTAAGQEGFLPYPERQIKYVKKFRNRKSDTIPVIQRKETWVTFSIIQRFLLYGSGPYKQILNRSIPASDPYMRIQIYYNTYIK
jgi:hypothetical protein